MRGLCRWESGLSNVFCFLLWNISICAVVALFLVSLLFIVGEMDVRL